MEILESPCYSTYYVGEDLRGVGSADVGEILTVLLEYLAKLEGTEAHSWVSAHVLRRYFIFQVVNVFLGVTFSTGAFSILQEVLDRPGSVVIILGSSVPAASTFFVNYLCLQALGVFPLQLLQPDRLVIGGVRKYFAKTVRQEQEAIAPCPYYFGVEAPKLLLVLTVGAVYSVINPLILPFATLYFAMGLVVIKYKLVYVHVAAYEGMLVLVVRFVHMIGLF